MKFLLLTIVSVLLLGHIGNNGADARRRFGFRRLAVLPGKEYE